MTAIPDVWPENIMPKSIDPTTPVVILRTQAANLAKRTQGIVIAKVESEQSIKNGDILFHHSLDLVAPLLGYRTPLVGVTHDVNLYPARIFATSEMKQGLQSVSVTNGDELLAQLKRIFDSKFCRQVISNYLTQSTVSETGEIELQSTNH